MKLSELEAKLYRDDAKGTLTPVCSLAEATSLFFLCPKCFGANGGKVGTHGVLCHFVGRVPDDLDPKPGRWNPVGTSIEDLSFVGPGAASILLKGGCGWHGFVDNGRVRDA